jgi:hypothetical protein
MAGTLAGIVLAEALLRAGAPYLDPDLRALVQGEAFQGAQSALRVERGTTIILRRADFRRRQGVVVVGDSMVFGTQVNGNDLFTTVLAERTGVSVLNLGIGSRGPCTYNYMLTWALRELPAPPSVVVYSLFANDFTEGPCVDQDTSQLWVWDDSPRSLGSRLRRTRERLFQYSILYHGLKRLLTFGHLTAGDRYAPIHYSDHRFEFLFAPPSYWRSQLDPGQPKVMEGFEGTLAKVAEAQNLVRRMGSRFVLLLMPFKEQVYVHDLVARRLLPEEAEGDFYNDLYDRVVHWGKGAGLATLDPRRDMTEAAARGAKLFWTLDGHLTPVGHQLVASELLTLIEGGEEVAGQ